MNVLLAEQASREAVVRQAVANLRARGITPRPAVLALYEQYVRAELSRAQVAALMQQRAIALLQTARSVQVEASRVIELVSYRIQPYLAPPPAREVGKCKPAGL